jgi:hypothetical protein
MEHQDRKRRGLNLGGLAVTKMSLNLNLLWQNEVPLFQLQQSLLQFRVNELHDR